MSTKPPSPASAEAPREEPTGKCDQEHTRGYLLAVDLGLRAGLACFALPVERSASAPSPTLAWFRSQHFASITVLKKAVPSLVAQAMPLVAVVVEGDRHLGDVWLKAAEKRGARSFRVAPETWRASLLLPRQQRHGQDAKAAAHGVAREAIEAGTAKKPKTPINDDVAEAICIGLYGLGLLDT